MFHGLEDTALHSNGLNNTWDWAKKDVTIVTVRGRDISYSKMLPCWSVRPCSGGYQTAISHNAKGGSVFSQDKRGERFVETTGKTAGV